MGYYLLEITTFSDFWEINFLNRPLKLWLIALVVFFMILLLKNFLAAVLIRIIKKIFLKIREFTEINQLKNILSWGFPLLGLPLINIFIVRASESFLIKIQPVYLTLFVIWFLFLAEMIIRHLFINLNRKKADKFTPTMLEFTTRVFKAIIIIIGLITILNLFKINVAGIITGLGIGGLAVSMAAKDLIADLIGGFTIMSERIFEIGDFVKTPDIEGTIEKIKFRQTEIRAVDQGLIIVPNSLLTENYVVNISRMEKRRINLLIHLPFLISKQQIADLKLRLEEYLDQHSGRTEDSYSLSVADIQKEDLQFQILYYIKDTAYATSLSEKDAVCQVVWNFLKEQNLEIPLSKIKIIDASQAE